MTVWVYPATKEVMDVVEEFMRIVARRNKRKKGNQSCIA